MPEVNLTHTEINPTHIEGSGGGKREFTLTETNPTFFGGGGGGWRVFVETESNPTPKIPRGRGGLPPAMMELLGY